ncbi:hypothetical protein MRX96_051325 [Rhipicephalus microplus]
MPLSYRPLTVHRAGGRRRRPRRRQREGERTSKEEEKEAELSNHPKCPHPPSPKRIGNNENELINRPHDGSTYKGDAPVVAAFRYFQEGAESPPRRMILFTTTLLLLAGLSQQQSTEDLNAYVDKILKEELPAEKIDPPDNAWLQLPHQGPPARHCSSYNRLFPYRVYVGCNVTYGEIKVSVKSQLKYDPSRGPLSWAISESAGKVLWPCC